MELTGSAILDTALPHVVPCVSIAMVGLRHACAAISATVVCTLQSARNEKMRIKSNVNLGALLDAEVNPHTTSTCCQC